MVYFEILIKEVSFSRLSLNKEKVKIKSGNCPYVSNHYLPILKILIENYLKINSKDCDTFVEICKKLRCAKTFIMASSSSLILLSNKFRNFTSLTTFNIKKYLSLIVWPNKFGNLTSLTILYMRLYLRLKPLLNELNNLITFVILHISK